MQVGLDLCRAADYDHGHRYARTNLAYGKGGGDQHYNLQSYDYHASSEELAARTSAPT